MSAEETGIIEFEVGLTSRTKSEIDEYRGKVEEIKESLKNLRSQEGKDDSKPTAKKRTKTSSDTDDDDGGNILEKLKKLDDKEVNQLRSFLRNPDSFLEFGIEKLLERLGPNAPIILGLVSVIVATPLLYIEILKSLSVKGGPFNRDWRRFIQEEVTVGITREQQKRAELGIDQVILVQTRGFVPNNEDWNYNSLMLINESRLARIGLDDRAAGVRTNG